MIGIDVGSDAVRICVGDRCSQKPLIRNINDTEHTMSTEHLWVQITQLLGELGVREPEMAATGREGEGIGASEGTGFSEGIEFPEFGPLRDPNSVMVAATCSMAVVERTVSPHGPIFTPLEDIIVWMDGRAVSQAHWVSQRLCPATLAQIGGAVTPEMGIAKLKWVDEKYKNSGKDVVVFELYDWVSYLFAAGGVGSGGEVKCLGREKVVFEEGSRAMDGLVKGWGRDVMEALEISVSVGHLGGLEELVTVSRFPYAGEPIAQNKFLGGTVLHGCIDCYAGIVAQNRPASTPPSQSLGRLEMAAKSKEASSGNQHSGSTLDMVAGTLTCFIGSIPSSTSPIPGLWGPFNQLMPTPVYAFGQPATGKLFAELLEETGETFESLEAAASTAEEDANELLVVLSKNHMYYGDRHGNRSPYGDFNMDEVRLAGSNADKGAKFAIKNNHTLQYYLLIEFLVFQTKQLVDRLGPLDVVRVSGSQARNKRFMRLLSEFAFYGKRKPEVYVAGGNATYSGASAGSTIASGKKSDTKDKVFETKPLLDTEKKVLQTKYDFFLELSSWQNRFRQAMKGI